MTSFKDRHGKPVADTSPEPIKYHGVALTDEHAERLGEETVAELRLGNLIPGRKSLTGGSTHSPRIQFRVPESLLEELDGAAASEHMSRSDLARKALEEYLRAHRPA